ncbi:MAG: hypothetical protein HY730_05225, partial [Candidatus Tectomicrobia bacterium]|nr:hypothetical protein [Candidatus Tectomicrobia bacterium]
PLIYAMDEAAGRVYPYGNYCPMWGRYGARKPVRTVNEARKILQEYFADESVKIDRIDEKRWYFQTEIRDKDDKLIDRLIVDKRTGRIRSIY